MSDTEPQHEAGHHPSHGALCYLQLPTRDLAASQAFYRDVLGWDLEAETNGFGAPGLIGQFAGGLATASNAGPLLWFAVDDVDLALRRATQLGGVVVSRPQPDGAVRWLATARDCSGNLIGLVHFGPRPHAPQGRLTRR